MEGQNLLLGEIWWKIVCFIAIKDSDEPENHWTVWSDDMDSEWFGKYPVDERTKEIALQLKKINEMAYFQYKPIVSDLCSRIASLNEVEHTLDAII